MSKEEIVDMIKCGLDEQQCQQECQHKTNRRNCPFVTVYPKELFEGIKRISKQTTMNKILEGNKLIAEFMGYKYFEANVHDDGGGRMDNVYSKVPIEIEEYDECKFFKSLPNPDFKKQKPEKWNPEFGLLSWQTLNHDKFIYGVLEYHTSWDWLWPVCEKIQEQTGAITLEAIFRKLQERYKKIICNRHQLWEAVIEYIKWYNKNKTS